MKSVWLALTLSALTFPTLAHANMSQDDVLRSLDDRYEQTADIAQKIWDWSELGYQEEKSSRLLKFIPSSTIK